jgi:hypothetical protein
MISIRIGQSCLSLRRAAVAFLMLLAGSSAASAQQMSVVNSPHNLSASGPGPIRAIAEDQPCIFCHTPHHSTGIKPLWNRKMSTACAALSATQPPPESFGLAR